MLLKEFTLHWILMFDNCVDKFDNGFQEMDSDGIKAKRIYGKANDK